MSPAPLGDGREKAAIEHRGIARPADDQVIEQRGADDVRRLGDSLREDDVLRARRRISAWMVVDEDERARPFPQHRSERITRGDVNAVEAARGDSSCSFQVMTRIDRERPQLFVLERCEPWPGPTVDRSAIQKRESTRAGKLDLNAPTELDRRRETCAFRQAHSFACGQLPEPRARETPHAAILVKQRFGEDEDGLARAPGSKEKRDELRTTERLDPRVGGALPRAVLHEVWGLCVVGGYVLSDHARETSHDACR